MLLITFRQDGTMSIAAIDICSDIKQGVLFEIVRWGLFMFKQCLGLSFLRHFMSIFDLKCVNLMSG